MPLSTQDVETNNVTLFLLLYVLYQSVQYGHDVLQ